MGLAMPSAARAAQEPVLRRATVGVLALVALTLLLLVWHEYGMNRVLRIDAQSKVAFHAIDDRSQGGSSVARLVRSERGVGVDCKIEMTYQWPFCELKMVLAKPPQGLDLSRFDTIRLKLHYSGQSKRVRVYLLNHDPRYSRADNPVSDKINELSYEPARYSQGLTVGLGNFSVAGWWREEMNIPLEHSQPDFRHITAIDIATGEITTPGAHRIEVESIEFHGKWLSAAQLRLAIIAMWLLASLVYLAAAFSRARLALRLARDREADLQALNQSLQLKGEELTHMAHRDPLTGALNRAGARDLLYDGSVEAQQQGRHMSLLFADLDHFKRINDSHGHAMGDAVLVRFVEVIRAATRGQDQLVRWGGEEFLLVLPDTTLDAAAALAGKLRDAMQAAQWPIAEGVTASFGVAELKLERIQDCISRADAALYRAKQGGRNRVELAD